MPGLLPGEFLLKSGDLFRKDTDDDFYFVSRSDEIIKSRGEKVSPAEVENAIYSLPAVQEVVVAGIPDPLLGAGGMRLCCCARRRKTEHTTD